MRNHVAIGAAIALTTVLLGTPSAQSADLTGVWLGKQKCDRFNGQKFNTTFADDVMLISQKGNEINMASLNQRPPASETPRGHLTGNDAD